MAWNDPPGNNNDPWGNRGDQGPPDLDEAIKKLQGQLSGIFGGKKDGSGPSGSNPFSGKVLGILLPVLAAFYLYMGVYQIDAQERGVVFFFGEARITSSFGDICSVEDGMVCSFSIVSLLI